jgi:DNA polymerase-2
LMPTVRGSDKGSKKRYAGVINTKEGPSLVFKGLENVRTDWTAIAREFQMELYRRVFFEEPYRDYISEITAEVTEGRCDQKLVYRKRLRRKLDDYQRNIPPHVQAARLARERGISEPKRGDWIEYVISLQGAEPADHQQSPLDYQHYIDSQLAPVADGILYFLDASFAEITGRQINLF